MHNLQPSDETLLLRARTINGLLQIIPNISAETLEVVEECLMQLKREIVRRGLTRRFLYWKGERS